LRTYKKAAPIPKHAKGAKLMDLNDKIGALYEGLMLDKSSNEERAKHETFSGLSKDGSPRSNESP